jgi:hypothetical protein
LSPNFYLDYHFTGSYGQSTQNGQTTNIISALGGLGVRFYAEQLADSRAFAKVTYATGSTPLVLLTNSLSLDNFTPISQPTLGLVFSPQLANILYIDLGYSLRPFAGNQSVILSNIEPLVGGRIWFRDPLPLLVPGGVPASLLVQDMNPSSKSLYLGTEITAGVKARIFSDLGLSVVGGMFLPSSDAFTNRGIGYVLKVDLSAAI